ncbi:MAG: DUF2252 domain-containing protein [Ilumatobacteraceae bacterium]
MPIDDQLPPAGAARRRSRTAPTVPERAARGRAARSGSPRSAHGDWVAPPDRRAALDILEQQARSRVADLVPIRYGRMAASPFAFYRGAAAVMAADLAVAAPSTGLIVQLCGDAHLANFGAFASPDRRLVFSINDFDETLPGPFEWDVKRMVASFAIAGRGRGFSESKRCGITSAAVRTYREAMREFAAMGSLDVWYTRLDTAEMVRRWGALAGPHEIRAFERAATRARSKDSRQAMVKLTEVVDGDRRFISRPPLVERLADLVDDEDEAGQWLARAGSLLSSYTATLSRDRQILMKRYRFVDIARKVVGVGSVGTRDWVVLMLGRDDDDPLLLQFKEADTSVLEPFAGASPYRQHGRRVVEGQRLMQAASDILLGWQRTSELDGTHRDYYVRQLWDRKGGVVVDEMTARGLALYASFCGWTLARAHARSGDAVAIDAYLGPSDLFDRSMTSFAEIYADQSGHDHDELRAAIAAGAVDAVTGV